jgi:hypothetical protein
MMKRTIKSKKNFRKKFASTLEEFEILGIIERIIDETLVLNYEELQRSSLVLVYDDDSVYLKNDVEKPTHNTTFLLNVDVSISVLEKFSYGKSTVVAHSGFTRATKKYRPMIPSTKC